MCEIFFAMKMGEGVVGKDVLEWIAAEALISAGPNKDGFGAFNEKREVFKSHKQFKDKFARHFVEHYKDSKMVVLHLRIATHGTVCFKNTHPFKVGNSLLVHNGIASFDPTCIGADDKKLDITDSQKILEIISSAEGGNYIEKIQNGMKKIRGSVSCFLYGEDNIIYYFRETSRFTFALMPERSVILGATDGSALKRMFIENKFGFTTKIEKMLYREPKERTVYSISPKDGLLFHGKFDMLTGNSESISGSGGTQGYGYSYGGSGGYRTPSGGFVAYDDLDDNDIEYQMRLAGVDDADIANMRANTGKHTYHIDGKNGKKGKGDKNKDRVTDVSKYDTSYKPAYTANKEETRLSPVTLREINSKLKTPSVLAAERKEYLQSEIDMKEKNIVALRKMMGDVQEEEKLPGHTQKGFHHHTQDGLCIPPSTLDDDGIMELHYASRVVRFNFFKITNGWKDEKQIDFYSGLLDDRQLAMDEDKSYCGRHSVKMLSMTICGMEDYFCKQCIADFMHFYIDPSEPSNLKKDGSIDIEDDDEKAEVKAREDKKDERAEEEIDPADIVNSATKGE